MLDTLDLQDQKERGDRYTNTARKRSRRLWGSVIGLALIAILLQSIMGSIGSVGTIYSYDGSISILRDDLALVDLQMTNDGELWAIDARSQTLVKYDGELWTEFTRADFGTIEDQVYYLSVYDDEVWIQVESDVAYYDGADWIAFNNILPTTNAAGIAAGDFGVVAADKSGTVAMLFNGEWTYAHVSEFLNQEEYDNPIISIMPSSDGDAAWISANGLAAYDGDEWDVMLHYQGNAHLLGSTNEDIWVSYFGRPMVVNTRTERFHIFEEDETGISPTTITYQAVLGDRLTYFAVSNSVYTYDGANWNQIPDLINDDQQIRGIILYDDNLIISAINNGIFGSSSVFGLLAPTIIFIAFIAIYYLLNRGASLEIQARAALVRKRLPDLLPDMVEYNPIYNKALKNKRQYSGILVGVLFIAMLVIDIIFQLPFWYFAIGTTVWVFLVFTHRLIPRLFDKDNDAASRAYLLRNMFYLMLGSCLITIPFWGVVMVLINFINERQIQHSLLYLWLILMGLIIFVTRIVRFTSQSIHHYYIQKPLRSGNYDKAIQNAKRLRNIFRGNFGYMFLHGYVLLLAGRIEEAEKVWHEVITEAQNGGPRLVSPALINLANSIQVQGRLDEALMYLEAAAKIHPEHNVVYRELAQHYILREKFPERAHELSNLMMHYTKKPVLNFGNRKMLWVSTLYTHAAALAQVGEHEEALSLINEAFEQDTKKDVTTTAYINLFAGHVYRALGDEVVARQHYEKASMNGTDLAGRYAMMTLNQINGVAS